jgi:tRNA G10  N-methylase Trm11
MPKKLYSETQELLEAHLKSLKERLDNLDEDREVLLKNIEQAERAFAVVTTRQKKTDYVKDSTFRQKVLFCLNSKNKILSINDMVELLTKLDADLKRDKLNTAKSLRVQVRRMLKEEILIEYKPENMKNIHYALASWCNENGEVNETYLQ